MRRPGRKRPSLSRYAATAELRDEDFGEEDDAGRGGGGSGEEYVAVASLSIVAISSEEDGGLLLAAGLPHVAQKLTLADNSVPQNEQNAMAGNSPVQDTAFLLFCFSAFPPLAVRFRPQATTPGG